MEASQPTQMAHSYLQLQAYKRIELITLWSGRFNTGHLIAALGISRQSASKLINEYKQLCPANLLYNSSQKSYGPGADFKPQFSSGSLQDFLTITAAQQLADMSASTTGDVVLQLGSSQRAPQPEIVRPIIQAIEQKQRLDIAYASINSPADEERIISPHTLIHDGHRWHVRAWCEKNNDYRDFVLTRIRRVFNGEGYASQGREADQKWHTWLEVCIEPDPRLDAGQRRIVALDYGMVADANGQLRRTYKVRAALLLYWLQQLRLDRYRERPEAQQIILSPHSQRELEPWLP